MPITGTAGAVERPRFVSGSLLRHVCVMAGTGAIGLIAVFAVDLINLFYISLLGEKATEEMSPLRAQAMLAAKGMMPGDGAAMVRVAEDADLDAVPPDATSLGEWLARARAVLPRRAGRGVR